MANNPVFNSKDIAETKAIAAQSRVKIENLGADTNGAVASRTKKPFLKIALMMLIAVIVVAGGIFVYFKFIKNNSETEYEIDENNTSCQKLEEARTFTDAAIDEFGVNSKEALKASTEYLTILSMCYQKIEYSEEKFTEEVNRRLYGEEPDEGTF